MKKVKQLLSTFLVFCMLAGMFPVPAQAIGRDVQAPDEHVSGYEYVLVNPEYAHLDIELPEPPRDLASITSEAGTVSSLEEAAEYVREQAVARSETIRVFIEGHIPADEAEANADWRAVWHDAREHTGVPDEGDYIGHQWISAGGATSWSGAGMTLTYTIVFFTTSEQEAEVDAKIESILAGWGAEYDLDTLTDYEKVCLIYDYICANVVYDYENLEDDTYKLKHSAYAALINGTSVCQGYAVLFYRLALELGVDARYISGDAGGPHGWNIVDMGNYYYYLDSTWDAGSTLYSYFLLGSDHFTEDHTPGEEYVTDEFAEQYPIDTEDYEHPDVVIQSGECGEDITWTLTKSGILTLSGTGAMATYSNSVEMPWDSSKTAIKKLVIEEGITSLSHFTGYYFTALEEAYLPGSLVNLGQYVLYNCNAEAKICFDGTEKRWNALVRAFTLNNDYLAGLDVIATGEAREIASGICGDDLTWKLMDSTLIISGTGAMTSYTNSGLLPWSAYKGTIDEVILSEGITSLSHFVCYAFSNLKEIYIPASVTSIGQLAFQHTALTDVYYGGTEEQWNAVAIDVQNDILNAATVHYNYVPETPEDPEDTALLKAAEEAGLLVYFDEYDLDEYTTRLDAAKLLAALMDLPLDPDATLNFADCDALSDEEKQVIAAAVKAGLLNGTSATTFAPMEMINRASVSILLYRALGGGVDYSGESFFSDVSSSAWYASAANFCASVGIIPVGEDGLFNAAAWAEPRDVLLWMVNATSVEPAVPDVIASGECGESTTWVLTVDGTLTISGTGDMEDYAYYKAPWYEHRESITRVLMGDGVTSLSAHAFDYHTNLTIVTIGSGVKCIGDFAFIGCTGLTSIVIPSNVETIGARAFSNDRNLTDLTLNEGLKTIGDYSFNGIGATSITIPASVESIGSSVFASCGLLAEIIVESGSEHYCVVDGVLFDKAQTSLVCYPARKTGTTYEIPAGVETIMGSAFYGCKLLESVAVSDSVTAIGQRAFYLSAIHEVELSSGVNDIGSGAFANCRQLENIHVDSANANYSDVDGVLYNKDQTTIVTYPAGRTDATYEIPTTVTRIGDEAFLYSVITSIELADHITEIGERAFEYCDNITEITIPGSV